MVDLAREPMVKPIMVQCVVVSSLAQSQPVLVVISHDKICFVN